MNEFQHSWHNTTPDLFNRSWSGWHHNQVIDAAETIILPSLIGIICSTGLVRNILIVFTIRRKKLDTYICNLAITDLVHIIGMPFLIYQWARGGEWVFGSPFCTIITSLDTRNQFACSATMTAMSLDRDTLYLTITTFFFPLPLIFICYILILCYMWAMYQQNKKAGSYTTSIPKQRVMRLAKMVLALVSVFVVSAAQFHVIQLMNLQVSQPMLSFYVSYYIAICLSYASSSINPILYILLSVNFQKRLRRHTNVEVRMAEQDVNIIERRVFSQEKCIIYV